MTAPALIAIDFAGTLSLDTVRFARADRVHAALHASGLAALGVDDADVFWSRIIGPTWQRGSTTGAGYATVVAEATADLRRDRGQPVDMRAVRDAAVAFTARYLASSRIAAPWWPWLRTLVDTPGVTVVIATDHYAELTGHLLRALDTGGVGGMALRDDAPPTGGRRCLVANSADVGHHKDEAVFWRRVRAALSADPATVLLVDDFGGNERAGDDYGDPAAVRRRRDRVVTALADAFAVEPQVYDFRVDPEHDAQDAVDDAGQWMAGRAGTSGPC